VNSHNFENPIIKNNNGPSILRAQDTFYMVAEDHNVASWIFTNNSLPIYVSRDLENWSFHNFVFTQENLPVWVSNPTFGFFSPDIQFIEGLYKVYYCATSRRYIRSIGVAVGPTPTGPFTDIGKPLWENRMSNLGFPNIGRDGKILLSTNAIH